MKLRCGCAVRRRARAARAFGRVLIAIAAAAAPLNAQELPVPIQVIGFTNLDYVVAAEGSRAREGFRQGEISMLVIAPVAENLNFYGEFSAHTHGGGHSVSPSPSFGVMRATLRYDFSDFLKVSAGRHHPRIGYWPSAFHHGVWLETSVGTPFLMDRHEGALPGHFLGVVAEGSLFPNALGLGYAAGIGNGRHLDLSQPGDDGDINDQRAFLFSLTSRPAWLFGLQLGGSYYVDRASPAVDREWDERILAAHVAWEKESPELLAEYMRLEHDPLRGFGAATTSEGYYAQLAYRLPGRLSPLKPYVRHERFDVPREDQLLAPLGLDYDANIAGLRWDFAPFAALKGEYRGARFEDESRAHGFVTQVSLTFGAGGGGVSAAESAGGSAGPVGESRR